MEGNKKFKQIEGTQACRRACKEIPESGKQAAPAVVGEGITRPPGAKHFHSNEAVFSGINYRSACDRLALCTQAELLMKSGCEWGSVNRWVC